MEGYGNLRKEIKMSLVSSRMNKDTKRNYYVNNLRRKINDNNFLLMFGNFCDILHVRDALESSLYSETCYSVQKFHCRQRSTELCYPRRTKAFEVDRQALPFNRVTSRRMMHKWIQS